MALSILALLSHLLALPADRLCLSGRPSKLGKILHAQSELDTCMPACAGRRKQAPFLLSLTLPVDRISSLKLPALMGSGPQAFRPFRMV